MLWQRLRAGRARERPKHPPGAARGFMSRIRRSRGKPAALPQRMITAIGMQLASAAVGVFTTRALHPAGVGSLTLILVFVSLTCSVGNLGLQYSILRISAIPESDRQRIIDTSFTVMLASSIIIIVPCVLIIHSFRTALFGSAPDLWIALGFALVPAGLLALCFSSLLIGLNHIEQVNRINLVAAIATMLLLLILVQVVRLGVTGTLIANLVPTWGCVFLFGVRARSLTPIRLRVHVRELVQSIKFGMAASSADILSLVTYRVDVLLVMSMLGVSALGNYSVCVSLAEKLWVPAMVAGQFMISQASRGENKGVFETAQVCRHVLLTSTVTAILLAVVAPLLIPFLFGRSFAGAIMPLQLILPGIVALGVTKVIAAYQVGKGMVLPSVIESLIAAIVNVLANIVLIPVMGIAGAAVASTLAYVCSACVALVAVSWSSGLSWTTFIIPTSGDLYAYARPAIRALRGPVLPADI